MAMQDKVKMTNRNTILNELMGLGSTLANHCPQNFYEVPDGYFERLANQVLNRIKALEVSNAKEELEMLSPLLNQIDRKIPYTVPVGYFDSLGDKLMQAIRENADYQTSKEELASLSPLLNSINKKSPYAVPAGYFENLSTEVIEKTDEVKVISITSHKWFRYAAAAVVVGFIAIAGLVFFNNNNATDGRKAIAKFEKDVKKLDNKQTDNLIQFIDAGMSGEEVTGKTAPKKTDDVNELLKDIPEKELQEFLEQTQDTEEVLLVN